MLINDAEKQKRDTTDTVQDPHRQRKASSVFRTVQKYNLRQGR